MTRVPLHTRPVMIPVAAMRKGRMYGTADHVGVMLAVGVGVVIRRV